MIVPWFRNHQQSFKSVAFTCKCDYQVWECFVQVCICSAFVDDDAAKFACVQKRQEAHNALKHPANPVGPACPASTASTAS